MDSKAQFRCGILTISDRCSRNEQTDQSGPVLVELLQKSQRFSAIIAATAIVPDDQEPIKNVLTNWSDIIGLNFIITSGGTGYGVRDFTPEATSTILDRVGHGMMSAIFQQTYPHSIMSRGLCGTRGRTLIINFPGSPKACRENFEIIEPRIGHILDLIRNDIPQVEKVHHRLQLHKCCDHHSEENEKGSTNPETVSENDSKRGVAFRSRKSPYPAVKVEDALQMIFAETVVIGHEIVELENALGKVLAEDVVASDPLPPFRASIKDGYAVISSDGAGVRRVLGASHAGGDVKGQLEPGFCIRITTGAPVPKEADAVVQVEDTELIEHDQQTGEELSIRILRAPKSGQDIRLVGSDIAKGSVVVSANTKLDPAALGVLATCGKTKIRVFQRPVIGILSTGDELVPPSTDPLPPGKIRDSNKTVLTNILRKHSFAVTDCGISVDEEGILENNIRSAVERSDVVIVTGGVSMGEKDLVKNTIKEKFGGIIHFGRVFMKPGLPTTFATIKWNGMKKYVFALPGNPVSAAVTCNLFVIPALRKISGEQNYRNIVIKAELMEDVPLDPRPEFHRVVIDWNSGRNWPLVRSTGNQISSRLLSMAGADALLCLPARSEELPKLVAGSMGDTLFL